MIMHIRLLKFDAGKNLITYYRIHNGPFLLRSTYICFLTKFIELQLTNIQSKCIVTHPTNLYFFGRGAGRAWPTQCTLQPHPNATKDDKQLDTSHSASL